LFSGSLPARFAEFLAPFGAELPSVVTLGHERGSAALTGARWDVHPLEAQLVLALDAGQSRLAAPDMFRERLLTLLTDPVLPLHQILRPQALHEIAHSKPPDTQGRNKNNNSRVRKVSQCSVPSSMWRFH